MANSFNIQLIEDGPRNAVIKAVGTLDTSDLAAAGQIGSGGLTTVAGQPLVQFTAGALAPTVGQLLTFSDGTTTFAAGTYVVSITDATHIVVNNNAKTLNAAAAITITGVAGNVVLADPATLCGWDNTGLVKAAHFRVGRIVYVVEDLLECRLSWDATTPVRMENLAGRGHMEFQKNFGGLTDNSGAGSTGRILLTTQGWVASAVLSFSIVIELTKQQN